MNINNQSIKLWKFESQKWCDVSQPPFIPPCLWQVSRHARQRGEEGGLKRAHDGLRYRPIHSFRWFLLEPGLGYSPITKIICILYGGFRSPLETNSLKKATYSGSLDVTINPTPPRFPKDGWWPIYLPSESAWGVQAQGRDLESIRPLIWGGGGTTVGVKSPLR